MAHEGKTFGLRAAEAKLARSHALTRTETFDENLAFPDLDENVRTRLGEDGPRIVLVDPVPGPFGRPVQTFNVPAHLFRQAPPRKEEINAARAEPSEKRANPTRRPLQADLRPYGNQPDTLTATKEYSSN